MSRSYRKTPGFYHKDKFYKQYSNHVVRKTPDLKNGCMFKKVVNPWKIEDNIFYLWDFNDYWNEEKTRQSKTK